MTSLSVLSTAFCVSLLLVGWIHPRIVRIAKDKTIVDNPDARKLQKEPVPVLGGVAVFFGTVIGIGLASYATDCSVLLTAIVAMTIMLYTGTMDDILNLSPSLRFVIEIVTVCGLIFIGGFRIDDFHGLWGLHEIALGYAVPLTLFAAVGIINAINLIDGVNGLSSGYCIMACALFGSYFYQAGNLPFALLAAVCAGALIPFFLHNVFGHRSRMFIGDGGTLVMGAVLAIFVCSVLRHGAPGIEARSVGLIPMTLAVLCIPVFDTLRVMSTRILHRQSPFHPDKTHLHHVFIQIGCSHLATTLIILTMNTLVVVGWWIAVSTGVSVEGQLYLVIGLGVLFTFGLYAFLRYHRKHDTPLMHALRRIGYRTHLTRTRGFLWMRRFVDHY